MKEEEDTIISDEEKALNNKNQLLLEIIWGVIGFILMTLILIMPIK